MQAPFRTQRRLCGMRRSWSNQFCWSACAGNYNCNVNINGLGFKMQLQCEAARIKQNVLGVSDLLFMLLDKQCHIFDTPLLPGHFQPWKHLSQSLSRVLGFTSSGSLCGWGGAGPGSVCLLASEPSLAFHEGLDLLSHTFTIAVLLPVSQASPQHPGSNLMHIKHGTFSSIKRSLEEQ